MINFDERIRELREKYKAHYKSALRDFEKDIYFDIIEDLKLLLSEIEQERARNSGVCEVCGKVCEQNHGKGRKGKYCLDTCNFTLVAVLRFSITRLLLGWLQLPQSL